MTEVAGGNERRARNGAREPDDRRRPPEFDERVRACRHVDTELRKVAPDERTQVVLEPAFPADRRQIEVVVAGNDGDFRGAGTALEKPHGLSIFAVEGQVRDVAGDDEMIGPRRGVEVRLELAAAKHAPAPQPRVCPPGHALVEEHLAPVHALG
jgi:hypothetical protein